MGVVVSTRGPLMVESFCALIAACVSFQRRVVRWNEPDWLVVYKAFAVFGPRFWL